MTLPRLGDEDESISTEVLTFLEGALHSSLPAGKDLLSITIPAPTEAAEKFLRLVNKESGFLWRSPGSHQFAGGESAAEVAVSGDDRFAQLSERVPKMFERVTHVAFDGAPPPTVLVGGAAFAPGVPSYPPWCEFTQDVFTLPKWGYRRCQGRAMLTLTVRREELGDRAAVDGLIEETRTLMRALDYESATSLIERFDIPRSAVHHLPAEDWRAYIDAIHAAIRSGGFQKIVAARQCVVELKRPVEDTGFMARVFAAYPDCTHFAFRRGESTFLGATPETLFKKRGLELETHALAGTTRVKDDPSEDSSRHIAGLRKSQKDLAEHALVVQRICEELWPLSQKIRYSSSPKTRQVRNLIHLQTPISSTLRETTSVFDLLAALHPTPAVGGFPAREAAEWIRQNEPLERGWYTGTLGWMDSEGNAEFCVAIRCGVLTPKRAYIFAGAGVVAASDADAEYAETAGKMAPVLRALGVTFS